MQKWASIIFLATFVSVLFVLSSCNESALVENKSIDSEQVEPIDKVSENSLDKVSSKVKPYGKIIGHETIIENGIKRKIPIYYGEPDSNEVSIKALARDYYSTTIYQLDKYQSKPGKWLGIWTNLKTQSDLYHKYGFTQLFVSNYQAKQSAISAGFKVDSLMGGINFSTSSVSQYGYLKYYHLDEPIEHDAYPEDIRLIGQYIHNTYSNSIMMMSSYRSPGFIKWYNWPLGRVATYKTLYKNETMDLASNTRIMCDYYHDAFFNPTDQRPMWSKFKTDYGSKNIANWLHLKEDSHQFGDNQFEELIGHAENRGINNLWVFGAFSGYSYLVDDFCDAAWKKGWLRKFVKKYKYMYHCPEYYGDPCYCSENESGWELAWIQYLGTEELYY